MKYIIANWKMNHDFDQTDQWLNIFLEKYNRDYEKISKQNIILCPPLTLIDYIDSELMEDGFSMLESFAKKHNKSVEDFTPEQFNQIVFESRIIKLGAQDCSNYESGSYTGQVSAKMLRDVGCEYVIIGHSERRKNQFEDDQILAQKIKIAIKNSLTPIFCIGENEQLRKQNQYLEFVCNQIDLAIDKQYEYKKILIAYEPIWAIGTGNNASLEQIKEMIEAIKNHLDKNFKNIQEFAIIYGGSVNQKNSAEILKIKNLDGLLVGSASLNAEEFIEIAKS